MILKLGCSFADSKNFTLPEEKLSNPSTSKPLTSKSSTRLLPIKPAAPVTTTFFIQIKYIKLDFLIENKDQDEITLSKHRLKKLAKFLAECSS